MLTLWPILYFFLFIGFFAFTVFSVLFHAASSSPEFSGDPAPLAFFPAFFLLHLITITIMLGLMIFYIVHLFKSPRVAPDKKILWLILLLLAGMFSMPVFFYLYVWREQA